MFRKLLRDRSGQALMMITIMLPVMLGFVGLAIEGGRFMMVDSQLQDLADAASLAGAKQLSGETGSIAAAKAAVNNTWAYKNSPWLANDGSSPSASQIASVHVCADISSSPCTDTTVDADAHYVQVTTTQRGVIPAFLIAVGAINTNLTVATATAESQLVACNVQPLMLCNPSEPNEFTANPGDLFGFTATGNTGGYSPGDFSLLDPAGQTHSSAPQIANLLAASNPNFCYVDSVSPAQGQKTIDVASGVNVRFDINPTGNPKNMDQTPAPNVIKGDDTNKCLQSQNISTTGKNPTLTAANAMPLATGMTQIGSSLQGGTFDSGNAGSYWTAHHGATGWPAGATRYSVYSKELDGTYSFAGGTSAEAQSKAPTCTGTAKGSADRRIISVAIVNCLSQNLSGNSNKTVFSSKYADFFLVRPVANDNIIYAEFIRFMKPDSDGSKLKQIVQLVRDQ
jgi:Flp pilus assembly protein TadG